MQFIREILDKFLEILKNIILVSKIYDIVGFLKNSRFHSSMISFSPLQSKPFEDLLIHEEIKQ